jgi:hypothetical protein
MEENMLGNTNPSVQIDQAFERAVKKDILHWFVVDFASSKAA